MAQINLTQTAGLIGFVPAALLCFFAGTRVRRGRSIWFALALIWALCAIEVVAGFRHNLHDLLLGDARREGVYGERRMPQAVAIGGLTVIALVVGGWLARRASRSEPILAAAVAETVALILLFLVESISLHQIDAIVYAMVGPIHLIGWAWLALGLITSLTVLPALRRRAGPRYWR